MTTTTTTTTCIELGSLSKAFGAVQAVDDVTMSLEVGEIVALLGPNGAGKSTTIDLLLGLAVPDAGSVAILGRPPREAIGEGAVGAMLQIGSLVRDLSVRELIAMMASLYTAPLGVDEVIEL